VIGRVIAVALGMAGVAGCALLSPPDSGGTTAVLDQMPVELPRREPRPVTLLVFPPEAKPIYDTAQMAYAVRPYEVGYFSRHQWGETPSRMLHPLLVRTLESTGYFAAVLAPPYTGRYTYALRTEILELMQDFASEPAVLRLSLRLRLNDDATGRTVATKDIALREPMQQKTPYAGVVAANDATAKALQEVARFVLEKAD
jgi:cholesterol transport system auxiliary component